MSDWDDVATGAERTWPDLLELTPLIPDDPPLPLIPEVVRADEQIEMRRVYKISYAQPRRAA